MDIHIIYPDRRWISEQTLAGWYADAVANMEAEPGARTIDEMATALEDIGFITRSAAPEVRPNTPCDTALEEGCRYERAFGDGSDVGG